MTSNWEDTVTSLDESVLLLDWNIDSQEALTYPKSANTARTLDIDLAITTTKTTNGESERAKSKDCCFKLDLENSTDMICYFRLKDVTVFRGTERFD